MPPLAGLFSAAGLLFARAECHDVRFCRVSAREPATSTTLARLEAEMRAALDRAIGDDVVEWQRVADVRYRGQSWSIPVELARRARRRPLAALVERFEDAHEQLYGTRLEEGSPVDVRALRLIALGPEREPFALAHDPRPRPTASDARAPTSGRAHGTLEVPGRAAARSLGAEPVAGPLLIDEYDTTVVVPPGWTVRARPSDAARSCSTAVAVEPAPPQRAHADAIARAPRRERARDGRRRDGDDDLPHRALGGRPRRDGLLGRALRPDRRDGRAGGDDPAPARLDPERDDDAARALRRRASRPGDVYIVNDPFDGASHTPDIFVVKPSFLGETLLGFAVTVAHHADVGGRVPGSCACDSTEVFQEGLRLPWIRLYAARRAGRGALRRSSAPTCASRASCSATSARRSPRATSATARCRSSRGATAPSGSRR